MEQTKALNALEPFLLLTKSATSPRAAADLITRATSTPLAFIFSELLLTPQISSLSTSSEFSSYLTLLQIFSYGTYTIYKSTPSLPPLNAAQLLKLRQLSFLSLARNSANLSYENLMTALGLQDARELENLVISAIYAGLVNATLDPYHQQVIVSSVSPLRDLQPNSIPAMINTLNEWSLRCTATLADLEKQIGHVKSEALRRHQEEKDWAAELEKLAEGKAKETRDEGKGIGSMISGLGRRIGGGAAAKRGMGAVDGQDDDNMDVDDEDEDAGERRGLRSGKKRGFGFVGGN